MKPLTIDRLKQGFANLPDLRFYMPHLAVVGFAILVGVATGFASLSVRTSPTDTRDRWVMPHWSKYQAGPKREIAENAAWLDQPGKRKTVAEIKPAVPPWRFIGTEQEGKSRFAVIEFDKGSRVQRFAVGEALPNGAPILSVGTGELTYSEDNVEKTLAVFNRQKDQNFPGEKEEVEESIMDNILMKLPRPTWRLATLGILSTVASCNATSNVSHVPMTEPMKITKPQVSDTGRIGKGQESAKPTETISGNGPMPPAGRSSAEYLVSSTPPKLTGEPVTLKLEGERLAAFINEVFGTILKVPFVIDDTLMKKDVIVTFYSGDAPLPRDVFYRMVADVLAQDYGIGIIYSNNVYHIVENSSVQKPIPTIIRTRSGAGIPTDMRPVFVFQPVDNVQVSVMNTWLELVMKSRVQLLPLPYANGVLLLGNAQDVNQAVQIIQTLDQPYLAGTHSLTISPAFWSAKMLSQQLVDILTAEGYNIAIGGANAAAIKLVAVDALNLIIVFGTGQEGLQHVLQWAKQLDQPRQVVDNQTAYYYSVQNTKAKDLADTIKGLVETTISAPTQAAAAATGANQTAGAQTFSSKQKIMVDEARNGIIFVGSAGEYAQFLQLVQKMDRAPLQVLIECTIAEVDLKEDETLGVLFNYDTSQSGTNTSQTSVKSDTGGIIFNMIRDHGAIMAQVNALADYNRLQVLSAPRLVTSSGKQAAISVGNQVPIIQSQETAPNATVAGTSSLLQTVQYRDTGIILNVTPTIDSNNRVELTVVQQVSDAQQNNLSGVQSPIIVNRSLNTTLSLYDGETALLGGMISENYSKGNSGIPYLKDIPVLGNLFKTSSKSVSRTELIVLLTPYIIDTADTARQVRDAFRHELGDWAEPTAKDAAPGTIKAGTPEPKP